MLSNGGEGEVEDRITITQVITQCYNDALKVPKVSSLCKAAHYCEHNARFPSLEGRNSTNRQYNFVF